MSALRPCVPIRCRAQSRACVLLFALIACVSAACLGQAYSFSMMDGSENRLDRAELAAITEIFELDDMQKVLVESVFDGYDAARRESMKMANEEMRAAFTGGPMRFDEQKVRAMQERQEQLQKVREEMKATFLADVKSLLRDDQLDQWPRYERYRRRHAAMGGRHYGRRSSEHVDLIDLIRSLEFNDTTQDQLAASLQAYELELDHAIQERQLAREEAGAELGMPAGSMSYNMDGMFDARMPGGDTKAAERVRRARAAISEINHRYLDGMASQVGPDDAARLREAFWKKAYPGIFRKTDAARYLNTVMALETLEEGQISAISNIKESFDQQVGSINMALVDLERQAELNPERRQREDSPMTIIESEDGSTAAFAISLAVVDDEDGTVQVYDSGNSGNTDRRDDPRSALRERKRQLSVQTIDAVFAILNAQQQAEAPKPKKEKSLQQRMQEQIQEQLLEQLQNIQIDEHGGIDLNLDLEGLGDSVIIQSDDGDDK